MFGSVLTRIDFELIDSIKLIRVECKVICVLIHSLKSELNFKFVCNDQL